MAPIFSAPLNRRQLLGGGGAIAAALAMGLPGHDAIRRAEAAGE